MINKFTASFGCLIILLLVSCAGLKTNTAAHELAHRENVIFTAICTSENKLAAISKEGIITIWDMNSGTKIREINSNWTGAVNSMIYTSNGQIIVHYKNDDTRIAVYDAENLTDPLFYGPYETIEHITCSPDGRSLIFSTVVVSHNSNTSTERSTDGVSVETVTTRTSYTRELLAMSRSYDGMNFSYPLPVSTETSVERTVKSSYDSSDRRSRDYFGLNNRLTSISVDQRNNRVACGFSDGYVRIYNTRNQGRRQIHSFLVGYGVRSLYFSPDGNYLLLSADRSVSLWNCATWSKIGEVRLRSPMLLGYNFDGSRFIVKDSGNTFVVFNSQNAHEIGRFSGGSQVQLVTFNSNNDLIAVGRNGKNVIIWDKIEL